MSTVAEIESALEQLPTEQMLAVAAWLDERRAMLGLDLDAAGASGDCVVAGKLRWLYRPACARREVRRNAMPTFEDAPRRRKWIPDSIARWFAVQLVACFVMFGFVMHSAIGWVPPLTLTKARMHWTEIRIRHYWEQKGSLPSDLFHLPEEDPQHRDNATEDEWGHELVYKADGTKVTLHCMGKATPSSAFDVTKPIEYEDSKSAK